MSDSPEPPVGSMYMYDQMTPPLFDDSYRLTVSTDATVVGVDAPLKSAERFFDIDGPRFSLAATEVAGVFPPRNGHGEFDASLPQIVLRRKTLPWERPLDPGNKIGTPTRAADDPPALPSPPWLALLLFADGEYTLHQNLPLNQVVSAGVLAALDPPPGITCDAVEVAHATLAQVMPSLEELSLLAHVRRVNTQDRDLSVDGSDGWFAVVMSNRLPSDGVKYRACLVSLEQRWDGIVPANPPPADPPQPRIPLGLEHAAPLDEVHQVDANFAAPAQLDTPPANSDTIFLKPAVLGVSVQERSVAPFLSRGVRLVLLHSWQFTCDGTGTFQQLLRSVNVGMIGTVATPGHPALTDTGHLRLELQDRAGAPESVWYRGPLVPFPLTRDTAGPYHSADQARRVSPETGGEDVSYASAFEVGRLLAASDPRLAQELMRWRRNAFRQSARSDVLTAVTRVLALVQPLDVHIPVVPIIATSAVHTLVAGARPLADWYGLAAIAGAPGLNAAELRDAWGLTSTAEATSMLDGTATPLGPTVDPLPDTPVGDTTIDAVVADAPALARLTRARDQLITNASVLAGGAP